MALFYVGKGGGHFEYLERGGGKGHVLKRPPQIYEAEHKKIGKRGKRH